MAKLMAKVKSIKAKVKAVLNKKITLKPKKTKALAPAKPEGSGRASDSPTRKKVLARKVKTVSRVRGKRKPVAVIVEKELILAERLAPVKLNLSCSLTPASQRAVVGLQIAQPNLVNKKAHFEEQYQELPQGYDKDRLVIQVRDPWWLHSYWEVRSSTFDKFRGQLGSLFDSAKKILRVYDVSFINFNGANANSWFDVEISRDVNSWYIDTRAPGRSWCVDFGLKLADGRFITILRSNVVTTPSDGPSGETDEEWMIPDELFAKLYGAAIGFGGGSSPVKIKKPWLELQKRQFASGGLSSGAFSPVKKKEAGKRKFWMVVNTELIVYGATEPDAKVTVQDKPIALRPDGTFSLRFSLPDGKQVIPVKGVSCDGIDEIVITPIVNKETK